MKRDGLFFFFIFIFSLFLGASEISGSLHISKVRQNTLEVQNLFNYGGLEKETPFSFVQTDDNSFIIVGSTESYGAGKEDIFIVKINITGELISNDTFGWQEKDAGYSIIKTSDGNYIITGTSQEIDGVGEDVLLLKINDDCDLIWKKEFGRTAWEWGKDLIETKNNEILIVGSTQDFWGADYDYYVIKTDLDGNNIWSKNYKISGNNHANAVIQAKDDNFLVVGTTSDYTNVNKDILIIKLNNNGQILWSKTYGGSGKEEGYDIAKTEDGYLIVGSTSSYGEGRYDAYVIKINEDGEVIWSESYGTPKDDHGYFILVNPNNEISIVGQTFDTDERSSDIYYLKINENGKLKFTEKYGTNNYDVGFSLLEFGTEIWLLGEVGIKKGNYGLYEIHKKSELINQTTVFDVTPIYFLSVVSDYGVGAGSGNYSEGSRVLIDISPTKIYLTNETRVVFSGWVGTSGGYTGKDPNVEVVVSQDILEQAVWEKQYYVKFISDGNGTVGPESGWYAADTTLTLTAEPWEGNRLVSWIGSGEGSYQGSIQYPVVHVYGPLIQRAIFEPMPIRSVEIVSEFGSTSGSGLYVEGTEVTIEVFPTIVYTSERVRHVFIGWECNTSRVINERDNPKKITVDKEDIVEYAIWEKQYYVDIDTEFGAFNSSEWYPEGSLISIDRNLKELPSKGLFGAIGIKRVFMGWILDGRLYGNKVIMVGGPYKIVAKWGFDYTYFIAYATLGVISLPLSIKLVFITEYNMRLKSQAKKEYNRSRGTVHKKIVKKCIDNLNKNIKATKKELESVIKHQKDLQEERERELTKAASKYLFDSEFTNIQGIGPILKERVRRTCFDGTLISLNRAWRVHGIGESKVYEIRNWVNGAIYRLPRLLESDFPGKRNIISKYSDLSLSAEERISSLNSELTLMIELETVAKSDLNKLDKVTSSTFIESYKGNVDARELVTEYHIGSFSEWERVPLWFKQLVEEYG